MFLIRIILGHMRRPRSLGIFKIKFDILNKCAKVFYMKLQLSSGMDYGIGANGEKICRGAKMGRPNILPPDLNVPIKLRMEKLQMVDGDYDKKGAYWGFTSGTAIYCAHDTGKGGPNFHHDNTPVTYIFVRAHDRDSAKVEVRAFLPSARFFN